MMRKYLKKSSYYTVKAGASIQTPALCLVCWAIY